MSEIQKKKLEFYCKVKVVMNNFDIIMTAVFTILILVLTAISLGIFKAKKDLKRLLEFSEAALGVSRVQM